MIRQLNYRPYKVDGDAMRYHRRRILRAMLELGAIDASRRRSRKEISAHMDGPTRRNYSLWFWRVRREGLLASNRSNRGGYWITQAGRDYVFKDLQQQVNLLDRVIVTQQDQRDDLSALLSRLREQCKPA